MSSQEKDYGFSTYPSSSDFLENLRRLQDLLAKSPIPANEMIDQCALYATPSSLRRFVLFDRLYQKILELPGSVMLFGVRWGRDLGTLQALHQIYEPMNHTRRMIGFDTFAGFPAVTRRDGDDEIVRRGAFSVTEQYEEHLAEVLAVKRQLGTFAHVERCELHKGDAPRSLEHYLQTHPETVVAMAYFDMDLYEPTKACAELLRPFLTRGAVIAFDDFIHSLFPGETAAAREIFGNNAAFRRITIGPSHSSYLIFE